jgi:hypothetical protein
MFAEAILILGFEFTNYYLAKNLINKNLKVNKTEKLIDIS